MNIYYVLFDFILGFKSTFAHITFEWRYVVMCPHVCLECTLKCKLSAACLALERFKMVGQLGGNKTQGILCN